MIYFLLYIFELAVLFFLARRLINSLARLIFRFTRSHHAVVRILAIFFLPGTIIHELAHLLFAGVMLVPVGEMNVIPEIQEKGGVRLGSVQIGRTDPLRRTIIGVAPVIFGMLLILVAMYFVQGTGHFIWWQATLSLYMIFEIGNTMFSSRKDVEGIIGFLIAIFLVALIVLGSIYFLRPVLITEFWRWLNSLNYSGIIAFFKMASIYLLVPIALDFFVIVLTVPLIKSRA